MGELKQNKQKTVRKRMLATADKNTISNTAAAAATEQSPLIALLNEKKFLVIDGALGTELEMRGCQLTGDKLWSAKILVENPQLIYQIHLDYFRAGADFVITSSYQASVAGFMRCGLNEMASRELIKKCVTLAKQARADYLQHECKLLKTLLVAGSVGPYGTYLADGSEYRGDYQLTHDEYIAFHRPRIETLVNAGVDFLAIETIPSATEIKSLLQLLSNEYPKITAYISFSIRDVKHLCDGTALANILPTINEQSQIVAVGVNCCALDKVTDALITLRKHTDRPLLVYPNSGEQYDPIAKTWMDSSARNRPFHEYIDEWIEHGAKMIGGCCRTNPQIIASVANKLNSIRSII